MSGLFRYVCLITFAVGTCFLCAQESETRTSARQLAELLVTKESLSRFLDSLTSVIPEMPIPNTPGKADRHQLAAAVKEFGKQHLEKTQVHVLQKALQQTLNAEFSEAELQTLVTFYRTELGQKWLKTQPALTASVAKSVAMQISNAIIDEQAKRTLEALRETLDDASLEQLNKAIAADAVSVNWLCQHWYELNQSDPDVTYYNSVNRQLDGTCFYSGITIEKSEKLYTRYSGNSRWTLMGRVILETIVGDEPMTSVYIIDHIAEDRMVSRLISEDTPSTEWETLTETTLRINVPPVPDGYTIEDETQDSEGR